MTAQGKVVALNGGRLLFDPARREIPIYFATHGAQITVLAGRIADGVMIANTLDPKAFDFYARKLAEGMAKEGRAQGSVDLALRVEACISDNDDAAFEVMRRRVTTRVLSQYPHWDYQSELGIELPRELIEIAERKDTKAAGQAANWMPRAVVESMVLGGNAERCAAQLARALDPRITSVMVRPHAIAGDNVTSVLKAFAEDVFPRALALRAAMPKAGSVQVAHWSVREAIDMLRYVLARLLATIPVVIMTSIIIFALMRLLPGDPVTVLIGQAHVDVSAETIARLRKDLGLDRSIPVQYLAWLQRALSGDFGRSIQSRQPVWEVVRPRILPTVQIGLTAWLIALAAGVPIGIVTATAPNTWKDWVGSIGALVGAAMPYFLIGGLLIYFVALRWGLLPASGFVSPLVDLGASVKTTILPALTLSLGLAAVDRAVRPVPASRT